MLQVQLIGNLGGDPEMRYMEDGQPLTSFSVACHNRKTKDGLERPPTWVRVSTWGRLAEHTNTYLNKGSRIYVQGRIAVRDYLARDGEKKYSIDVTADRVEFLSSRQDSEDASHLATPPAGSSDVTV